MGIPQVGDTFVEDPEHVTAGQMGAAASAGPKVGDTFTPVPTAPTEPTSADLDRQNAQITATGWPDNEEGGYATGQKPNAKNVLVQVALALGPGEAVQGIRGAVAAYKAAQVAKELQAINAARTAAGVAKLTNDLGTSAGETEAAFQARLTKFIKETQDSEITAGTASSPGGPAWKGGGKFAPVQQDMTAEELQAAKDAALEGSARRGVVGLLKNPTFWKTAGVATAGAAGGGLWQAMSGIYHMRRTAQFLSHIFGE